MPGCLVREALMETWLDQMKQWSVIELIVEHRIHIWIL